MCQAEDGIRDLVRSRGFGDVYKRQALKLAENMHQDGIKIIGTSFNSLDIAEDRGRFSDLLKEMGIPLSLIHI